MNKFINYRDIKEPYLLLLLFADEFEEPGERGRNYSERLLGLVVSSNHGIRLAYETTNMFVIICYLYLFVLQKQIYSTSGAGPRFFKGGDFCRGQR